MAERVGRTRKRRGLDLGGLLEAHDQVGDLRAVDADIGERTVIERHQLVESALPLPPVRDSRSRRSEKIDKRHGTILLTYWCTAQMGLKSPRDDGDYRKPAMLRVMDTDAFRPAFLHCNNARRAGLGRLKCPGIDGATERSSR